MRAPRIRAWALGLSVVLHAGLATGVAYVALHRAMHREVAPPLEAAPQRTAYDIELPTVSDGDSNSPATVDPKGIPVVPRGGALTPRADTGDRGHGGDAKVTDPAMHLADQADDKTFNQDLLNRLDRDQIPRIDTKQARAAWEDRRATTTPMEASFLDSSHGKTQERRPDGPDPSRGAKTSPQAATLGGAVGTSRPEDGEGETRGAAKAGTLMAFPGAGVAQKSAGFDHRTSADSAYARPSVVEGPPTIPAEKRDRPNDTVDSDQNVANALRTIVQQSTAGGDPGIGRGGSGGGGAPGAGGTEGAGSKATVLGNGGPDWFDLDSNDPGYVGYFRAIKSRIDPHVPGAFPRQALLDLKQGFVILDIHVRKDGTATVGWPPIRPSGIDEFDANCAALVRRLSPFPPIPDKLGKSSIHLRARLRITQPL